MEEASNFEFSNKEKMNSLTQTILFNLSGKIIKNTGSIPELAASRIGTASLFQYFPIIESLVPIINDEVKEDFIQIPKVETAWEMQLYRIYDLSIEKIKQKGITLLKCTIKDLTDHYEKLTSNQQERNEEAIKEQIKKD